MNASLTGWHAGWKLDKVSVWLLTLRANMLDLMALHPVTAGNVNETPVPLGVSQEITAKQFYGNYIRDIVNNQPPNQLTYVSEPILTINWDEAM